MKIVKLSTLKQGEYFKRIRAGKPAEKVYTRGAYDRGEKRYDCADHDDIWGTGILLRGSTNVAIGFTY